MNIDIDDERKRTSGTMVSGVTQRPRGMARGLGRVSHREKGCYGPFRVTSGKGKSK